MVSNRKGGRERENMNLVGNFGDTEELEGTI